MFRRRYLLLPILVLSLATVSVGQIAIGPCIGDDGFNGPCCVPATPNLPNFPAMTLNGQYGCLLNCALEAQFPTTVALAAPIAVTCDYYLIPVTVTSGAVVGPNFTGVLIAKYARTWMESIPGANLQRQVWRFLVNADINMLAVTTAGAIPCPVPPCAPLFGGNVHFTGHVDYAADCGPSTTTSVWSLAMSLNHVTGCVNHHPVSARPLAGPPAHSDRNYSLVAPANFVFAAHAPLTGTVLAEDTRSSFLDPITGAYICYGETDILQGSLTNNFNNCYTCVSPAPAGPAIWRHQTLATTAFCNGMAFPIGSIPVGGLFPTGLMALSLGNWTAPAGSLSFPGNRTLDIYYGALQYTDPCNPGAFPFHAVVGVGNNTQANISLFGAPLPTVALHKMLDLENMLLLSTGLAPGIGDVFYSSIVWNLNML